MHKMSERAVAAVQRIEYHSNRISQLAAGDPAMMQINPIQASNKKPGRSLSHARTEADGREGENEADQPNDGRWCHDVKDDPGRWGSLNDNNAASCYTRSVADVITAAFLTTNLPNRLFLG